MERKSGDNRIFVPKPDSVQETPVTTDIPVYDCSTMSDEELIQAVLHAGAQSTTGEIQGTK